jgi:eukaryotic-like serine/threonine-protein kinase
MIDTTISHYRIVEKLGHGGIGIVYKAVDTRLHRFVALKFLPEEIARDPKALSRFQRTALALSALNHPNICPIYDIDVLNGQTFFATEFLDGVILKIFIAAKPLETQTILTLAIEIADALNAAHSKGIIHGNIKPSTIIVTRRNQAKLLDFGLARALNNAVSSSNEVLGYEAYMSPEQVKGEDLDARTDFFSFGAVLYEMCTGAPPFRGNTPALIFKQVLDSTPPSALQLNPALPTGVELILNKALEKDRNLRCQSATEMKAAFEKLRRIASSGHHVGFEDETSVSLPVFSPPTKES